MQNKLNDTLIFVHPFTSVEFSLVRAKERGYKIITIKTPLDKIWIENCWDDIKKYSDFIFESQGNIAEDFPALEQLIQTHNLNIVGVLNCFDGSLFYSDSLANKLLGYNLNLEFSQIRTNKFQVNENLRKNGLNYIKSIFINSIDDFKLQHKKINQFNLPIIVKPAGNTAARNDVKILHSFDHLEETVKMLLTKSNLFASVDKQQLLIQEYITGDEYIVNAVSAFGKHCTTGVFKYRKEGNIFKGGDILGYDCSKAMNTLIDYNTKCLDALKVNYGITHNEIILTPDNVPYIVEMNNRMGGPDIPLISMDCYGINEIDVFLNTIEKKPFPAFEFKINRYGSFLYFTNFFVDTPTKLNLSKIIADARVLVFRPTKVNKDKTQDGDLYFKTTAAVYLSHFSKTQLDQDVQILFDRERDGSLFIGES